MSGCSYSDGQLPWLMDVEARSTLTLVAKKVETRAAKRKAEAEAAAEAERLESERVGAACKAWRAMIAVRTVKECCIVLGPTVV